MDNNMSMELIKVLREDCGLSRDEILIFLDVSNSTFDKMVSNTSRPLPKKSKIFLESVYQEEDWEKIIDKIKSDKKFVKQILKVRVLKDGYKIDEVSDNVDIFISILENKKIQGLSPKKKKIYAQALRKEESLNRIEMLLRLYEFFHINKDVTLEKEDYINVGLKRLYMENKESEIIKELEKMGKETIKSIKIQDELI